MKKYEHIQKHSQIYTEHDQVFIVVTKVSTDTFIHSKIFTFSNLNYIQK